MRAIEMRVAIDYTAALRQGAGIGRYTRGLVEGLCELNSPRLDLTLVAAADASFPTKISPHLTRLNTRRVPLTSRQQTILWHRLHVPLPLDWLIGKHDLVHAPDFVLPPLQRARGIITVHDLSFLRRPDCAEAGLRKFLTQAVPRAVQHAQRILADSISTKNDLVELLNVDPKRVDVVYPGVGENYKPVTNETQREAVRARYNLPASFVLSVGTLEPRKNFAGLITAFARMRRETGLPHKLVIAGGRGWLYDAIFARVQSENVQDAVHFLGYVDENDLPVLYNMADLFAFPSLYEGFGIPIVEAMACRTPVVCTNNSSLPEAAGDAALLVQTENDVELAEAMARVLTNPAVAETLRERGEIQAAKFTWRAAAQQLVAAYARAMGD